MAGAYIQEVRASTEIAAAGGKGGSVYPGGNGEYAPRKMVRNGADVIHPAIRSALADKAMRLGFG